MKKENLNRSIINAAKWSSFTEVVAKIISPITNMILARIVLPEDFGVVATITMITSFADMFTDAGFQKYLVQYEFKDDSEKIKSVNVAFWTNFSISLFLWIIIIIFRDSIAMSVGNPDLGNVIAVACIQLLLTSFSSIQMALYRRNFDFKTLFLVRIIGVCIPFIVTIPLAILGLSYWALIIGNVLIQLSNAAVLTIKSKWKPQFFYEIKILKKMISFSLWSLLEAISIWFSVWADTFIIGSFFNQYYLGLYKTSTSMVNTLMALITASILPVLFSALSRLQGDIIEFNKMYFKIQKIVAIFVFPLSIGLYLYSDLATKVALGSNWREASNIIGIWALTNGLKIVLADLCGEVYRAKGKPKISLLAQLLHLIVLVPTCVISSKYGFWILVYARSWIRMELILVQFSIMKIYIKFPIEKVFRNVMPSAVSACVMGVGGWLLQKISNSIIWNLVSIMICSIVYFRVLYIFPSMRNEIKQVFMAIKTKLVKDKCKNSLQVRKK
ncbi:lipopolysaccharide biosynthesis protein [Haloimpatiens sp. FM7330]|uniref:lipopolysaccharide biosynthesis protein n=1 Tax=Haloimpatiens sp. FM7330 TaxID=3298610 RepID=UPI00363AF297